MLVSGGTGTLGRQVVQLLASAGESVRVLTRDRVRARELPPSVAIVEGDVRRRADVEVAVRGCTAVISAVLGFAGPGSPSPEAVDRDGNAALIAAAKAASVERFVLASVHGARPDHPMSLHRAKYAAEDELRRSGLPFTIVRPTAFVETWITVIGGALESEGHALVFGPGTNPINFVSARDVADLVVRSVRDRVRPSEVIEIGGPENLGFVTVAERLVRARGGGRIKHVPLSALRALSVLARPFAPVFARLARAAVVMNTTDMTFDAHLGGHVPAATTLDDVLASRAGAESAIRA
jgi:uncharacterized protein YbjT (DUF2867 family)